MFSRRGMKHMLCLMIIILLSLAPFAQASEAVRKADASTVNQWKQFFGEEVKNTVNAGSVWMDKSVFADANALKSELGLQESLTLSDPDAFLATLSLIASNKSIKGQATIPTDTVFVLDMSGSMTRESRLEYMIPALNNAVTRLMELNIANRIGVVLYYGTNCDGNENPQTYLGPSPKNSSHVLLSLGRYQSVNGEYVHLDIKNTDDDYDKYRVSAVAKTEAGGNVAPQELLIINYATYIQNGVLTAWDDIFSKADITVNDETSAQHGQRRMPIMVLMTDGAPNASTSNFTVRENANGGNSIIRHTNDALGFENQLTAAYVRWQMEKHYNGDGKGHQPLVYTLSLDLNGQDMANSARNVAKAIMNPISSSNTINNWWRDYCAGKTVKLDVPKPGSLDGDTVQVTVSAGNSGFTPSVSDQQYVNQYFEVENAQNLTDAFNKIVQEIILQSLYYPTNSEEDSYDLDGYVTFVDHLGHYMEAGDVKGIVMDNKLYSGLSFAKYLSEEALGTVTDPTSLGDEFIRSVQTRLKIDRDTAQKLVDDAFEDGHMYYNSDADWSNCLVWFADASGTFLGGCTSGSCTPPQGAAYRVRSYGFLDDMSAHGINSNLMYVTVQVRTALNADGTDGNSTVVFKVPASLIPLISTEIEYKVLGGSTPANISYKRTMDTPIRLIYEVSLRSDINPYSVANIVDSNHRNADGSYTFYTNHYNLQEAESFLSNNTTNTAPGEFANTVSYFDPSRVNERYFFIRDTLLYEKVGDSYQVCTDNSIQGKELYVPQDIYALNDDGTAQHQLMFRAAGSHSLTFAQRNGKGEWYLPIQTPLRYTNDLVIQKALGDYVTPITQVALPIVHKHGTDGDYHVASLLGNNGSITIMPREADVTVYARKEVSSTGELTHSPEGFEFELVDAAGEVVTTAFSDAEGLITLPLGGFDSADIGKTYNYTLREKRGNVPDMFYSRQEFTLQVRVEASDSQFLTVDAQWLGLADGQTMPVFVNNYHSFPPETGDNTPLHLLMLVFCLGLSGLVLLRRRSREG